MDIKAFIAQYPGNAPIEFEHRDRFRMPGNLRNWSIDREDMVYTGRVRIAGKEFDTYCSVDKNVATFDHEGEDYPVQIVWTYLVDKDGALETMLSNTFMVNFEITDPDSDG